MNRTAPFFDEARYQAYLRTLVMSRRRIVFAVQFDKDASHLAAGNSAGHLHLFDLRAAARDFSAFPALLRGAAEAEVDRRAGGKRSSGVDHEGEDGVGADGSDRGGESGGGRRESKGAPSRGPPSSLSRIPAPPSSPPRLAAPSLSIDTGGGAIYGMFGDDNLLFCGTDTAILVYRWADLLDDTTAQCAPVYRTTVQVVATAAGGKADEPIETNAITGRRHGRFVYAATGHGSVDCFAADNLKFQGRYRGGGIGAYLHCIAMRGDKDENSFVTGGEDGVVRVYDARVGKDPVKWFDLRKLTPARRQQRGGWVGCVASDTDGSFIVCGAGNRTLTTIHLASGSVLGTTALDYVPNALAYCEGEVYCGGADKIERHQGQDAEKGHLLYRYDLECTQTATSPVSASGVYALATHPTTKSMAAGGYSTRHRWHDAAEVIDVYINPPVRSFSMAASELALNGD